MLPTGVRQQVVEIKKNAPTIRATRIAEKVGVSRERVRQILKQSGLCTHLPHKKFICNQCGKVFEKVRNGRSIYCSTECWQIAHRVTLTCEQCGQTFTRRQSDFLGNLRQNSDTKKFYCSKKCQGKYVAAHFGFPAHPENAKGGKRKHDWDAVWQKHLETGYGAYRLSRILGIPEISISHILKAKRSEESK